MKMDIYTTLTDLILSNVGQLKSSTKLWKTRNCMLCASRGYSVDKRSRFGIRFDNGTIQCNCFNCGFSASWGSGKMLSTQFKFLLTTLGVDPQFLREIEFEIYKSRHGLQETLGVRQLSTHQMVEDKWVAKDLPRGAKTLTEWANNSTSNADFLMVIEYALQRGLTDIDNMYWTPDVGLEMNKRLIIPFYYRGRVVGYTGRYTGVITDKSLRKYIQFCPSDFVFNLDRQMMRDKKYVILTEGVLDALSVDGVSTLGDINKEKAAVINRIQKSIIVSPDRDSSGGGLVKAAVENGWAVSFPKWDHNIKDASGAHAVYGRLLTVQSIIESAIWSPDKASVQWELETLERARRCQHQKG